MAITNPDLNPINNLRSDLKMGMCVKRPNFFLSLLCHLANANILYIIYPADINKEKFDLI